MYHRRSNTIKKLSIILKDVKHFHFYELCVTNNWTYNLSSSQLITACCRLSVLSAWPATKNNLWSLNVYQWSGMARVQVTSYFKIVWTKKVVTHFLILIDRGMQEEDVCVFSEPQEMKMISPPPLLIDSRLQTTKDFQLCPLFLIRSVGIPGFVCCPVTSLRALC